MRTYFITANDTDSGKTFVAGILAKFFAAQGLRVQIVKPIECGDSGDAESARQAADSPLVTAYRLYSFPEPMAPMADENVASGPELSLSKIVETIHALPETDIRLVEGAGGIAVPIDAQGNDWRDFIETWQPDLTIAVVEDRLGAINQSRMLHAYLGTNACVFLLNETKTTGKSIQSSNRDALAQAQIPLLGCLRFGGHEISNLDLKALTAGLDAPSQDASEDRENPQKARLLARQEKQLFRRIEVPDFPESSLNLADNDYLGLRKDPRLIEAGQTAIARYGTSSSASPLITGYTEAHASLEATISEWYGNRSSLIWNSGYAANQSVLKLFIQKDDLVLADRLIHNSLISGILDSGARLVRFQHNQLDHLETLLQKFKGRRIHVVTESVYSMDGDYPDLKRLAYLKSAYGFTWFLDEAHAVGWFGASGSGLAEAAGVIEQVDILTGTLGKALASVGAYTVFSENWMRDCCINEAGEFIYSTYFPPANAAIAEAAIQIVLQSQTSRLEAQASARKLRTALRAQNWDVLGDDSPIVPVVCGDSESTLELAANFLAAGLKVASIRPPTVPKGAARLRLSLKSTMTNEDHARVVRSFEESRRHV